VKTEWHTVRIDEICTLARGGSPRPIKNFITDDDDGLNWIKIGDATGSRKYITSTKQKIKKEGRKRSRFVEEGDFLLSNSMSFGRPYILKTNGCIHDGWLVLKPDYKVIDQEFLYYALLSPIVTKQFEAKAAGSTVRNLNIGLVSETTIPLPPLEEQRQIVTVLDEVFAALDRARGNVEANLADARESFYCCLHELLELKDDWDSAELNTHVHFIDYRGKTPPKTEDGVRLITAKNVRMGFIKTDPIEFMDSNAYDGWMTRGFPKKGDVLFTTEAPLANVAQLDTDETVVIGQRLITMQADKSVLVPKFLKFSLLSPRMQKVIHTQGTGATVKGIKSKLLKKIPLNYPTDLAVQDEIAQKCEKAFSYSSQLEQSYKTKLTDIDDLRQSLLQRTFAGKLTHNLVNVAVNDNERDEQLSTATLVLAFDKHLIEQRQNTFGHVKAQKTLHLTESIGGLDLGRQPQVRQAGPHDQEHFSRVEAWAKQNGVFEFKQRRSGGYTFNRGTNYDAFLLESKTLLADYEAGLSRFLPLMVDMNTEEAEVFTTVHAAWNNLLADGKTPNDDDIVTAARENWHESKMEIARQNFFDAITKIRRHDLEPDGTAKYVRGAQESLI